MTNYKLVAQVFNDFLALYRGKGSYGIEDYYIQYAGNTLFEAMMGNLNAAQNLPSVPDALKDMYEVFKKYRGKRITDRDWETIHNRYLEVNKKYHENRWCQQIMLVLMKYLENDDRELAQQEEKAA